MKLGFFESLTMIVTLMAAIPMLYMGTSTFLTGNPRGLIFIVLGVTLVLAERFLTTPLDIPAIIADKTVGRVLPDPDETDSSEK